MEKKRGAPSAAAAAAAAAGAGPEEKEAARPLTELEEIQLKMNQVTDESLDSTRRMMQMCEAAKDAGINTLVLLDDQGEQLERVNGGLDSINADMKEAEKTIEQMEKCCGLCVLPWKKGNFKKGENYNATWKSEEDGQLGEGPRIIVDNGIVSGGFIKRVTNDAREEEIDKNIGEVNGMVSNLRNMAIDMGNQVTLQNKLLDKMAEKANSNQARIQAANTRATKLLN